ncbi:MAG: hypothetical protein ACYCSJ_12035 [Acidimicrobiales bacterium]
MSIRFDAHHQRAGLRSEIECPSCGRALESAGLARVADLMTAHLRFSCPASKDSGAV